MSNKKDYYKYCIDIGSRKYEILQQNDFYTLDIGILILFNIIHLFSILRLLLI